MKRALLVLAVPALLALGACQNTPKASPGKAAGSVEAESTTTSSTTTTTTGMTGTTNVPAGVAGPGAAGCGPSVVPDGASGSAGPESLRMVSPQKGFAVNDTSVVVTDDG